MIKFIWRDNTQDIKNSCEKWGVIPVEENGQLIARVAPSDFQEFLENVEILPDKVHTDFESSVYFYIKQNYAGITIDMRAT